MATALEQLLDFTSGRFMTKEERAAAEAALKGIEGTWDGIETPNYEDVNYTGPEYAGDVTAATTTRPDQISVDPITAAHMQASTVGPSAMGDISGDPRLREAQLNALGGLEGIVADGGMTAMDKANMSRMTNSVNQQDRGRREAIQQGMARRGMGGSGMDLLAQLQSSQGSTDRAAQQGLDIQGMAQARALEAMMQSGQLGGAIRGQDFGEDAAKAQAADAIARFNAGQTQVANQFNTGATNQFALSNQNMDLNTQAQNINNDTGWQQFNTGQVNNIATNNQQARQGVSNAHANAANDSQQQNKIGTPTANFNNNATVAKGKTGGKTALATFYGGQAEDKEKSFQDLVAGGTKIYTAGQA